MKSGKWTENGLCIKCQGIGHVISEGVTSEPCSVCDGMGRYVRKARSPNKPKLSLEVAEYVASKLNEKTGVITLKFTGLDVLNAIDEFKKQVGV